MNRELPKFVHDEWCWDYTRARVEKQSGRSYEDWIGPDFAAATVIYRNVERKYGEGRETTTGLLCPKCNQRGEFLEGDYICHKCRMGV
jgi:hypothetical protein